MNKGYSRTAFVLFLIAAVLAILKGLISIILLIALKYIPSLDSMSYFIGDGTFYIAFLSSILGLFLGIALFIASFRIKNGYESGIFHYIGWILAGFVLTEFSIEAILVLIGFLIGIIKHETRRDSVMILSRFAIIIGFFSLVHCIIKYFINKKLIEILGNFLTTYSMISTILGAIVFLISIIIYYKIKNNLSKKVCIFSIIIGVIGFFSFFGWGGLFLVVMGIIGIKLVREKQLNRKVN